MKSERAKAYINENVMDAANLVDKDGCGWAVVGIHHARKAVELAEQEAEDRMREELTRWHDPKEVLPNKHHRVLLKAYKNGSVFMEVGSLQATDCGLRFIFSECDGCNVIGWREINE